MIATCKDRLLALVSPTQELHNSLQTARTQATSLRALLGRSQATAHLKQAELADVTKQFHAQQEQRRTALARELRTYRESATAEALYHKAQTMWRSQRRLVHTESAVKHLERLESKFAKRESQMRELNAVQQALDEQSSEIAQVLQQTNTLSLADLGLQLENLKRT